MFCVNDHQGLKFNLMHSMMVNSKHVGRMVEIPHAMPNVHANPITAESFAFLKEILVLARYY